jgi:ribosomal protein S18 acetylase RimI-like enzyme
LIHSLDNPIWNSLNTVDAKLNRGTESIAIYSPEVSPFVGLKNWDITSQEHLFDYLPAGRTVSTLVAEPFLLTKNWELVFSLGLYQMVCSKPKPYIGPKEDLKALGEVQIPAMIELTGMTKPGPFMQRTIDFGNYVGIFEKEQLIAMAGERLHLTDYTEISAVCTHPSFTGKGYAAMLVNQLSNHIQKTGKTAFLHVRQDNLRAISLYQGLGFDIRTEIYFAVIKPKK